MRTPLPDDQLELEIPVPVPVTTSLEYVKFSLQIVAWENKVEEVNRTKYRNSRVTVLPIPFPWLVIMVWICCYLVKNIIPIKETS
jgi:hypothetical protein